MPIKLIVLVLLMSLNVAASVYTGSFVSAVLQMLLVMGLIAGKEGIRRLLIVLSIINAGVVLVPVLMMLMGARVSISRSANEMVLFISLLALAAPLFAVWVLTRKDVQVWMFKRSMGIEGAGPPSDGGG